MLKTDKKLRGIVVSLLAAFFYGVAAVLTRIGVRDTSPIVGAAIAFLTGMVIMIPLSARGLSTGLKADRTSILYLLLSGLLASLGIMAYYAAMATTPVAVVTSITSANPLATILLAHVFFRRMERITKRVVMGAVLVVAGVVVVTIGRYVT